MTASYDPITREYVVTVYVRSITRLGSVRYGHGFDQDGRAVSFVGDPTELVALEERLGGEDPVVAAVPTWAIFEGSGVVHR